MRKIIPISLLFCCALALRAQTPSPDAPPTSTVSAPTSAAEDASSKKARAALDDMVRALGGNQWLNYQNSYVEGRIAGFFQGKPTGATVRYWDWRTLDAERIDLTEGKSDKHNWTQIFSGKSCWEVTFRGKNRLPRNATGKLPLQVLQSLAERHLAQQVTLLNSDNDSITIQIDAMTHLPLRRSYFWRDPVYKDKNEETEEYDDYHNIDGIQTPFTITRLHNGDMTSQRFIFKAAYNVPLAADAFDADAAAAKIHK